MIRIAALVTLVAGCVRVAPHQREHLAQPVMQQPAQPAQDHIYEVREGTGGATGSTGGGCGCN